MICARRPPRFARAPRRSSMSSSRIHGSSGGSDGRKTRRSRLVGPLSRVAAFADELFDFALEQPIAGPMARLFENGLQAIAPRGALLSHPSHLFVENGEPAVESASLLGAGARFAAPLDQRIEIAEPTIPRFRIRRPARDTRQAL